MDRQTMHTTTNAGAPVASDERSLTQGAGGGILLHDHYLLEKMAQFNRERVPERVVPPRVPVPSGRSWSPTTSAT